MLSCRHCLQDVMCWAAIQELKERGGLRTWLFLSSANKAEILFRWCRVGCGEIRLVEQSDPLSLFLLLFLGRTVIPLSADLFPVDICGILKRSLDALSFCYATLRALLVLCYVYPRVHVATRGSRSVNFSLTIWFKSKICLHLAVCVG